MMLVPISSVEFYFQNRMHGITASIACMSFSLSYMGWKMPEGPIKVRCSEQRTSTLPFVPCAGDYQKNLKDNIGT